MLYASYPPPLDSILPIADLLATYFIIFVWKDDLDAQFNGRAAQSRLFQVYENDYRFWNSQMMHIDDLGAYLLCKQHWGSLVCGCRLVISNQY